MTHSDLFRHSTFEFRAYIQARMNHLQLIGLIACAATFAGCQSTETTGRGNQVSKRLAAIEREREKSENTDEARRNLWNAHWDIVTRDGNAAVRHYY